MIKAVYPGSFDPITNGHLNIINRASKLYDELIVLVAISPAKKPFFSIEEKVNMIKDSVKDLPNVKIDFYNRIFFQIFFTAIFCNSSYYGSCIFW